MDVSVSLLFIFMLPYNNFIINQKIKNLGYNGLSEISNLKQPYNQW